MTYDGNYTKGCFKTLNTQKFQDIAEKLDFRVAFRVMFRGSVDYKSYETWINLIHFNLNLNLTN